MASLSLQRLKKTYRDNKKDLVILDDITINFPDTGIVGLLGKNGSGKTTLIKSCVNLVAYTGNISYFGTDLQDIQKKGEGSNYYSALFEGNRNIYWKLTPLENLKYFASLRGVSFKSIQNYATELFKILDLDKKTNSLVETLSRGMQQKVALVIALSFASPVVFLDEPTLGLDMETQNQLITFLNQKLYTQQQLFLISSHDLNFVTSTCDNVYLLKNGKLHEYNSIQSRCAYRLKSYAEIHILKPFLQIEETTERIFTYNITDNILEVLSRLSSRECETIISIVNTKYDIEEFYKQNSNQTEIKLI